jgi:hypothetical protein
MQQTEPVAATEAPFHFCPDWGAESWHVWKLIAATRAGELPETLDALLRGAPPTEALSEDQLKVAFSTSLLADILRAGGNAWVRESRLLVSWPDWGGSTGRELARIAMSAARDLRPLTQQEIDRVTPLFAKDLDGEELSTVLREATFRLEPVTNPHPTGVSYQEAFAAALRYWSMPYRGRSGRMKRFVLSARHSMLGPHPVVAAILELGDEAPFCTWRDDLLGLSPNAFLDWLRRDSKARPAVIADRLREIRATLRRSSLQLDLANADANAIVQQKSSIEEAARGRSQVKDHQKDLLKDRKRMAYGLRLARGEAALRNVGSAANINDCGSDLSAGIRAIHDLILPRVHMEATVCGAIPPFSNALGGKLIVSFLSHPDVVSSTLGAEGELLNWSFDATRLERLIPSHGMLCITTKGLYARHAPMYARAVMPGANQVLHLRHLANTGGTTTTLVSDRTAAYARALLGGEEQDQMHVSNVYGSGGAKRHRAIEAATIRVGLPARIAMAGIRRPVYGTRFVENPERICWLGESPKWLVHPSSDPDEFCSVATELWRQRWLARAIDRIQDYVLAPSLPAMLRAGARDDAESALGEAAA